MKRIFCLLLTAILLFPLAGFASGIDITALSDADLEALYDAVLAERLVRMKYESFVVQKGEYRIGVDVPSGAFRVEHSGGPWRISNIIIKDSNGSFVSKNQVFSDDPSGIGRIVLEQGFVLVVEQEAARFFVVAGGVTFD